MCLDLSGCSARARGPPGAPGDSRGPLRASENPRKHQKPSKLSTEKIKNIQEVYKMCLDLSGCSARARGPPGTPLDSARGRGVPGTSGGYDCSRPPLDLGPRGPSSWGPGATMHGSGTKNYPGGTQTSDVWTKIKAEVFRYVRPPGALDGPRERQKTIRDETPVLGKGSGPPGTAH